MNNFNSMGANSNFLPQQRPYFTTPSVGASTPTNNLVWVQGIEGAKAWQLSPNSMVILLDSETEGKMYIKVSDNIGMCTLRIFNYTEELQSNSSNVTINQDLYLSQYVRKDELTSLIKETIGNNEQPVSTASTTATNKPKVVTVIKK